MTILVIVIYFEVVYVKSYLKMKMANFRSSICSLLSNQNNVPNNEDVVMKGNLVKRKNMKNRFFVLKKETSEQNPARLECYDNEKKFMDGGQPKKKYILKDCFNISQKTDKHHFVIALFINKDCIGLVTKTQEELEMWLKHLLIHKNARPGRSGDIEYKHVWEVDVLPRSFASKENLTGQHWLCLTNWLLSLVNVEDSSIKKEFQLSTIRKCGFLDQFFFFQLGLLSGIGCGELYMRTEDAFIAQNIHNSVGSAMNSYSQSSLMTEPTSRNRTSSDAHAEDSGSRPRNRAHSVPNNPRGHPSNMVVNSCHSHRQPLDALNGRLFSLSSFMADLEEDPGQPTPNSDFLSELGKEFPDYVDMKGDYVLMDSEKGCDRHPPNTLGVSTCSMTSPRSRINSPVDGNIHVPLGTSTPVSPSLWPSCSLGSQQQLPSPQLSLNTNSRNPSYVGDTCGPMLSPGNRGSQFTDASSHYLEMGPKPSSVAIGNDRRRTISTPTPIPLSPSDEESCYEMFPNSGSSSCNSGTPSDHQLHEFTGDERDGDTPRSGVWASLSHNYNGIEDFDSPVGGPRNTRTNSVGSKPDQFRRKNRLDAATPAEPARVRAFSVGSRVSFKFGVGRHGATGAHQGAEHPAGVLGEMFSSIKECGKQAKNKSSSAPMLGASPISHSWSGTSGTYFRGSIQTRSSPRETNLMELDFSKNKSCDFIPSDYKDKDKERKTSKERIWNTFTGHRHRTNSKSSGSSNSKLGGAVDTWGSKEKRTFESEASSRGVEIPNIGGLDRNDCLELNFTSSPRNSDPMKGYLPMNPPSLLSSSLTTAGEITVEKRGPRTTSFNETCYELSSSLSSCASQDGYVDMTRGGSSGALTIASSSSSSNSINATSVAGMSWKTSSIYASVPAASQDLPSPLEDLVMDEEFEGWITDSKKKSKKNSKRKSLRESNKRKKSESSNAGGDSPEVPQKPKSQGPFATLTNFISRKPNGGFSKAPLSPKGSPLPPKGNSPFSSLKRTKSKDKDSLLGHGEDRETVSLSGDIYVPPFIVSSPPTLSPQSCIRRKTLGGFDTSPPPPLLSPAFKSEEKMLLSPQEGKRILLRQSSKTEEPEEEVKRISAYVNMEEPTSSSGSLPSLNSIQNSTKKSPCYVETIRNYVNMQPGNSSPQLSPPVKDDSSPISNFKEGPSPLALNVVSKPEDNYMMMGGGEDTKESSRVPALPSEVAKRPEIPPTLLSSHSQPPSRALEKLSLKEEKPLGASSERSRSHSGPGAPEASKDVRQTTEEDGRAASACSSPISYSPPTSPTLGSMSSMSSLSEGGLSSASSTCTVVNVGIKNLGASIVPRKFSNSSSPNPTVEAPSLSAALLRDAQPTSSSSSRKHSEEEALNYVALDLGSTSTICKNKTSPRVTPKCEVINPSQGEDTSSSYVEIDFKKSEGLRNTSLARDTKRPH